MAMKYKRIILKLSGEALADKKGILDHAKLATVAKIVKQIRQSGVDVGIVVGAELPGIFMIVDSAVNR